MRARFHLGMRQRTGRHEHTLPVPRLPRHADCGSASARGCRPHPDAARPPAQNPEDNLSEFADALIRFPSRPDDSRDFELGTFNPDHADGGARMHFFCADAAGHAVVEVKLRGDACRALSAKWSRSRSASQFKELVSMSS